MTNIYLILLQSPMMQIFLNFKLNQRFAYNAFLAAYVCEMTSYRYVILIRLNKLIFLHMV